MAKPSPFDFDISVSADKRRRARTRRGMTGAFETSSRTCGHPGCDRPGNYRAPQHPDKPTGITWYCRDHARQLNHSWNFFDTQEGDQDMDPDSFSRAGPSVESAAETRGSPGDEARAWDRFGIDDPFEVLGKNCTRNPGRSSRLGIARNLSPTERRAVRILDAREHWTKESLRKRYKNLVKDLHPDMNGGDRTDEARLQEVVWAWEQLRKSSNFRE